MADPKAKRPPVDWEAIEREYRAGQLSIREIARLHGISDPAILKRAKLRKWSRDLTAAVHTETARRLVEVSAEVSSANARKAVDTAAARAVEVIVEDRQTLARLLARANKLIDFLEAEDEAGAGIEPKDYGGILRDISSCLSRAIPLRRQAFNIGTGTPEGDGTIKDRAHAEAIAKAYAGDE